MMDLLFKRPDGSFVAKVNGWPYHVTADDPLYEAALAAATKLGKNIAFEQPAPSPDLTIEDYETAIQAAIDETARAKQFRDGVTMASYAASANPQWAEEAQAFIAWRDGVWAKAYGELAKVEAGKRKQPTIEEFISEIAPIIWP